MKVLKQSARTSPKVSLILLDWSVRESFHLLHYLASQDIDREMFEVVVIEYYANKSEAIRRFEDQVDSWILLEMPDSCYYHKHLMYNAGIVASTGEVCVVCDSDAMVKPSFVRTIVEAFDADSDIVLHIDQFRNERHDLYPFSYPSFEEVLGPGCMNNFGGRTTPSDDDTDSLHSRNYGACMCARRVDLIAIGGADEHIDFLGHICGPYDMTFRLVNLGRREVWHASEFMFHTWHPGQAGADNYLGPHDGRHVSTTSLDALARGRILPLVENSSVACLRKLGIRSKGSKDFEFDPAHLKNWERGNLPRRPSRTDVSVRRGIESGFVVEETTRGFVAFPRLAAHALFAPYRAGMETIADSEQAVRTDLERRLTLSMRLAFWMLAISGYVSHAVGLGYLYVLRRIHRLTKMHRVWAN